MSCLEQITQLRQQHEKTLELYKDLYDSFIAPNNDRSYNASDYQGSFTLNATQPGEKNVIGDVTAMIEETQTTINSTCDLPRDPSQNSTISEMWSNFSIDQYAPREKRSTHPKAMSAPPIKKSKPRRPHITVPDPFYMTLREELKKPSKTKAQEEAELKKIEEELEEDAECRKQFKASPLPPSTFQKKLKLLQQKQEDRRRDVKEQSKALTKALQKPFSFETRGNLRRSRSLSALDNDAKKLTCGMEKFNARPMPHYLFDPEADEKVREEEAYREIRMKMRAEQLLADSALPSNMQRYNPRYTDGKIRRQVQFENEQIAHLTEEHTFQPVIKDFIPDYSLLHKQQEEELLQKQTTKATTVVEPFNLRTEQLARFRADNPKSSARTVVTSPPQIRSPCLYTGIYNEAPPTRATVSSNLRDSATRTKILQEKKKAQLEYEHELVSKVKQLEIRKSISKKSKHLDPTVATRASTQRKLSKKIEQQKQQELEYKQKLEEMRKKLEDRPFLFERASMDTARLSADKAFRKALAQAGVDVSLINEMSNYEEDSLME